MGDATTKMIIKEVGSQMIFNFTSNALPKETAPGEQAFKYGEEFEWKNPFDPNEKLKVYKFA